MSIVNNDEFESEKARHGTFFAREDILDEIQRILDGTRPMARGWLPLFGGPGVGKSAIMVHLLEKLKDRTAFHFVRRGQGGQDRPEVVERSLCAQIKELFAEHLDADFKVPEQLADLLTQLSRRVLGPCNLRLLLMIDGLDELSLDNPNENPFTRFLPEELPKGVVVLCATRPSDLPQPWIHQRGARSVDLDSPTWLESNKNTIRIYWEKRREEFSPPLSPKLIELAIQRSAGNLLYAACLYEWLLDQPVERRDIKNIPPGLGGFVELLWAHLRTLDEERRQLVLSGLGVACSTREALPAYVFESVLGWRRHLDVDVFLRVTRPFLIEETASWHKGDKAYRLYHEWLRELLIVKLGAEKIREHHGQIADTLAKWPPPEENTPQRIYALHHAVEHLIEAGRVDEAKSLCTNVAYLEKKCAETDVSAVERELEAIIRATTGEDTYDLSAILAALSAEGREILVDRSSLPVRLYNRLLCTGWTAEKIEKTLQFPAGLPPLRLRHRVRMEAAPLRSFLDKERPPLVACAVRPGGRQILSASTDPILRLWSLDHGDCIATLQGHKEEVTSCAFSHNGKAAISTSTDGSVMLWNLETGVSTSTIRHEGQTSTACAFTKDDQRFAVGFEDGTLRLWNSRSSTLVETLYGHTEYITACDVTLDGRYLVTASRDESLHVWDLVTFKPVHVLKRSSEEGPPSLRSSEGRRWFTALAIATDGRSVYATSGDGYVTQWSLASGEMLKSHPVAKERIDSCALTGNGRLLCGLADGTLLIVSLPEMKQVARLKAHTGAISACAATLDGQRVITASQDRTLKLWELSALENSLQEVRSAPIVACAMTPDEKTLVYASVDGSLKTRDLESGKISAALEGHENPVTSCAISVNGKRVASGTEDGKLRIWYLSSAMSRAPVQAHTARIASCVILPGDRILTASRDGNIKLWGLLDMNFLCTVGAHGDAVESCAVSANGAHALSLSRGGVVKLWSLENPGCVWTLDLGGGLCCGALSPDGRRAALGRADGSIDIYDTESCQCLETIRCTEGQVLTCSILPSGDQLVAIFEDRTLRVFSLKTYKLISKLQGRSRFRCLATASKLLCVGDEDGSLWMIEADAVDLRGGEQTPRTGKKRLVEPFGTARIPGPASATSSLEPLRDILTTIYPTEDDVRIVADDTGINVSWIQLGGSATHMWHTLLIAARNQGRLEKLACWLARQNPGNDKLIAVLRALELIES